MSSGIPFRSIGLAYFLDLNKKKLYFFFLFVFFGIELLIFKSTAKRYLEERVNDLTVKKKREKSGLNYRALKEEKEREQTVKTSYAVNLALRVFTWTTKCAAEGGRCNHRRGLGGRKTSAVF